MTDLLPPADSLSPEEARQIWEASQTMCAGMAADPALMAEFLRDPHACLVRCHAPIGDWPASYVSAANAVLVEELPSLSPHLLPRSGPGSWACWTCWAGLSIVIAAAAAAAGIALAGAPWAALLGAPVLAAIVAATGLTAVTIQTVLTTVGTTSLLLGISRAATLICEQIPGTCAAPTPYTGPWHDYDRLGDSSSHPPALVSVGGAPTAYFKGAGSGRLYQRSFDVGAQRWTPHHQLGSFGLASEPAVHVLNGQLFVVYLRDGQIRVRTASPQTAPLGPEISTGIASPNPPGLGEMGGELLGAFADADGRLWTFRLDATGQVAQTPTAVAEVTTHAPPALAWLGDRLLCFYRDGTNLGVVASTDATTWTALPAPSGPPVLAGPSASALRSSLVYCCYAGPDQQIWYAGAEVGVDGELVWSPFEAIHAARSATAPAFLVQGSALYVAHRGRSSDKLYVGTTPT